MYIQKKCTYLAHPICCKVLALLWACLLGCGSQSPGSTPPNIILITIDTLRADHVGVYGGPAGISPNLDAIAKRGVRFDAAFAPTPLTLPSHTSLMTGQEPQHHGVRHNGLYRLPDSASTLAEIFQSAGYETAAFVGATVLAKRFGLDQGFDHYDDQVLKRRDRVERPIEQRTAAEVEAAASTWLKTAREPYFLWLHFYDPHAAYDPPEPYASRFSDSPYAGEIASVDASIGRLLDALGEEVRARTVIAITADHGESLGEHSEPTHAYSLYDATQHIPMLLAGPGIPAGRQVTSLVRLIDLAPTLTALAGLKDLGKTDGSSLVGIWDTPDATPRIALLETLATRIDHGWAELHAVRSKEALYIRAPKQELYFVLSDPRQLQNLFPGSNEQNQAVAHGEAIIKDALASQAQGEAMDVSAKDLEQLRALGYAIPDRPLAETGIDPKDGLIALQGFAEAAAALARGDAKEATATLLALAEAQPQSASVQSQLALLYLNQKKLDDALVHALAAHNAVPSSVPYERLLASVYAERREWPLALAAAKRAVTLDDHDIVSHMQWMDLEFMRGSTERAIEIGEKALNLDPANLFLLRKLAKIALEQGKTVDVEKYLVRILALDPDAHRDQMGHAIQLAKLGRLDESIAARKRANEAGQDPKLVQMLALAMVEGGFMEEAEKLLRNLLEQSPEDPTVQQNLDTVLRRKVETK